MLIQNSVEDLLESYYRTFVPTCLSTKIAPYHVQQPTIVSVLEEKWRRMVVLLQRL